jgi:predicted O-methyltransferase YrrM
VSDGIRRTLRDKLVRVVQEVVDRQQAEQLRAMRHEMAELRQQVAAETNRMIQSVRDLEHRSRRDLVYAGDVRAVQESSRFLAEHMASARQLDSPHNTLKYALSLAPAGGLALEFGVYTGTTLAIIADGRTGDVYGFDSFQGLPSAWRPGFPEGTFGVPDPPHVPGADLVVGLFADVLPGFLAEHPGPVDFLHVDCDLYSSTVTVLDLVGPRLRPGSVIVFDEYFNYPGWERHEYRAWLEYVDRTGVTFDYEGFTYDNEQVIVRLTGTP